MANCCWNGIKIGLWSELLQTRVLLSTNSPQNGKMRTGTNERVSGDLNLDNRVEIHLQQTVCSPPKFSGGEFELPFHTLSPHPLYDQHSTCNVWPLLKPHEGEWNTTSYTFEFLLSLHPYHIYTNSIHWDEYSSSTAVLLTNCLNSDDN